MTRARLLLGTNRSSRPACVDDLVRGAWGRALLLVPTQAQALRRTETLLLGSTLPGAWGKPVRALTDFAEHLLLVEGRPLRRMDDLERRLVLDRVLAKLHAEESFPGMPDPEATPGMARHLLQVIVQLKQAAVEPDAFRKRLARVRDAGPFDELVARAYEDYHEALIATDAYDVPGLFWQAHLACLEGKPRALDGVALLALDGFDDFTPSELRFVEGLARHAEELVIGVNHDVSPGRKDLFSLPERTCGALRERFDVVEEVFPEPEPTCQRSWLAQRVFWRDARPYPEELTENLQVWPCVDAADEAARIGRRVKVLLRDGAPPEDIALLYRNPADALETLREVFREYGIPLSARQGTPLRQSGIGAFLLRFFEAMRTWSRDDLLEVLMSPWAHSDGTPDSAVPLLVRAAGIVRGRAMWESRLAALRESLAAKRSRDAESLLGRVPDAAEKLDTLQTRLAWLAETHDGLPDEASQAAFAHALDHLLDEMAVETCSSASCRPEAEREAIAGLRHMLSVLAATSDDMLISRSVFLRRFEDGLRSTTYTAPGAPRGVTVTDPRAVRGLTFRHVFLAGMNEGLLPAPVPMNAIYGERDLERLRKAGLSLEGTWAHHAGERLLFHHALESATESLTLSWCALKEGGREAMPSPFLADVRDIFKGHAHIESPVPRSEEVLPEASRAASPREYAAGLAAEGLGGDALAPLFPGVAHALTAELKRNGAAPFGPWDGALQDGSLQQTIAASYGPNHHFSANQIESYVACPFQFFLDRVLRVEEPEAPAEELDPRTRGSILHAILQRFHRQFEGTPIPKIPRDEAQAALDTAVREVFKENWWRTVTCSDGLLSMEAQLMRVRLQRYLRIAREDEGEAEWAPRHFEAAFGRTPREDADTLRSEQPYPLKTPAGDVLFAGVVDRIDVGHGDAVRLVDYKSSTPPAAGDVREGKDIQLGLYTEVVERLLIPGTMCQSAVYLVPGRDMQREVLPKKPEKWPEQRETVARVVGEAVEGIRDAHFPPTPSDDKKVCSLCGRRSVCRYDEHRVERKKNAGVGGATP